MATATVNTRKRGKAIDKDYVSDRVTSKKEKVLNIIIFILLLAFAFTMVFPLIYMVATSFMTKMATKTLPTDSIIPLAMRA